MHNDLENEYDLIFCWQ